MLSEAPDTRPAIPVLREAIELLNPPPPDRKDAMKLDQSVAKLGKILIEIGYQDEAEDMFRRALLSGEKASPTNALAFAGLTELELNLGRFDEALVHISAALPFLESKSEVNDVLGDALRPQGDILEALGRHEESWGGHRKAYL